MNVVTYNDLFMVLGFLVTFAGLIISVMNHNNDNNKKK